MALALSVVVAGCARGPTVEVTASPVPESATNTPATPGSTPTPSPPSTATSAFPLTGVATDDARLDEPVLAAKIDNHPDAFPHVGLERADVVYEEVVESGMTRLVPLFHSDVPEVIGPVRSGRLLDVELLSSYRPVMAFAGARPEVMSALTASDDIGVVSDSGELPFFRGDERALPHNLFFDSAGVLEIGRTRNEVRPVTSSLTFGTHPDGGTEQTAIDIAMTYWQTTGWRWDDEQEVYRRLTRGEPYHVTGDEQVGAANVVVVLTQVSRLRAGEAYMHTDLTGEGEALLLRDGRRYDVKWRKQDTEAPLEFVFADGSPVPFATGSTWIHLAPVGAVG